jgi:hypothetical protein
VSVARTEGLAAARKTAYVWNSLRPGARDAVRATDATLAGVLDEMLVLCQESTPHRAMSWKQVSRGTAENGYQPETEYFWSCPCREGHSDDMGESVWAKQAVDKHIADPTQFPGWSA